jgi:hypothetical protein
MLIEKYGCDPNVVTKSGESVLYYACRYGHINIVKLLIENYGCDPNVVTRNDESLLHYTCLYCHINVVKLLIEKYGCDPNLVTEDNQSLLHYACQYGDIDVVKYLINQWQLNPLMRDNINQLEPLDYAVNNNQLYTAVYICQNCISTDEMLSPNRIKTTINLIKHISLRYSTHVLSPYYPAWTTANGDNILQLVGSSEIHICSTYAISSSVTNTNVS